MLNKNYDHCFMSECNATVLETIEDNGNFWHYLDNTVFFVESGGMKSDTGLIDNYAVLDLKIENNKIWHLLECKLEGNVHVEINLHERFRKAQIHTAQHLLTALLQGIYKTKKITSHIQADFCESEYDLKSFSKKQCAELQILANGLIRDDLPVNILYPRMAEAAKRLPVEKLNHDEIRVVSIGNLDYNPCGCIHVPSLKYLQMIKIIGYEKTPRGIKIFYNCGDQLLEAVEKRYEVLDEASHALSLPHVYINSGINKLQYDKKILNQQLAEMKNKYYTYLAKEINETYKDTYFFHELKDFEAKDLHQFALGFVHNYEKAVCLMTRNSENGIHLVVAKNEDIEDDANALFKKIAVHFDLKGGGNKVIAQGSGKYVENMDETIKKLMMEEN